MIKLRTIAQSVQIVVFTFIVSNAFAQGDKPASLFEGIEGMGPHEVVDLVATELIEMMKVDKVAIEKNPEAYFADVKRILSPVVNFKYISKNVMGEYWAAATPEQRAKFKVLFEDSLVRTYGKGMANFADHTITVEKPEKEVPKYGKTYVIQKVSGDDGVNRISYTMGKSPKGGGWKLINVVLKGVNLGKTFRNQFAQAVKENGGDVEAAISGWPANS